MPEPLSKSPVSICLVSIDADISSQGTRRLSSWMGAINGLYLCELALIWAFGSIVAWHGDDVTLLSASIVGGVAALLALYLLHKRSPRAEAWRGVALFAASWLIFPLFKAIRQGWIITTYDAPLLHLDRALWGGLSLPEYAFSLERVWLSEIICAGYFAFYFVVLLPVIWAAFKRASPVAQRFLLGLNLMYMIGFIGYVLVPAGGPYMAFPQAFPYPVHGGPMTAFLTGLVAQGITGMDVFPSLHSGVSIYVWGFFLLAGYRRVTILLTPVVLCIVVATVYLRYHYGIDLLAGVALAIAVLGVMRALYRGTQ